MEGLWIEILTCAIVHPTETQQELAKETTKNAETIATTFRFHDR